MFCASCSKLAFMVNANRLCLRCNQHVNNNLSVLCESCSTQDSVCAVCLKKVNKNPQLVRACKSCGK